MAKKGLKVCRQLGLPGSAWVGLGPPGMGKRTLQVRAEKRLRESAEERSARLLREVAGLAGDTAEHQATIESLSRRLDKVRSLIRDKETRLSSAAQQTTQLQARLKGIGCSQDKMFKSRKHASAVILKVSSSRFDAIEVPPCGGFSKQDVP
eukprot:s36_g37.t1